MIMNTGRIIRLPSAMLLVIGVVSAALSLVMLVNEFRIERTPVVGSVVGYDAIKTRSKNSGLKYKPCVIFTYEVAGLSVTGRDCTVSYRVSKQESDALARARERFSGEVTVWVNSADPSDARLRKHEKPLWAGVLAVSLAFTLVGRYLRRRDQALAERLVTTPVRR